MKTVSKILTVLSAVEILVFSCIALLTVFEDKSQEQTGAVLVIGFITVLGTWATAMMSYNYGETK